jgi:hypothetical protein
MRSSLKTVIVCRLWFKPRRESLWESGAGWISDASRVRHDCFFERIFMEELRTIINNAVLL